MVEKLQEIAQQWETLLYHYPRGLLNLKKCFWFIMYYWQWHQGQSRHQSQKSNSKSDQLLILRPDVERSY